MNASIELLNPAMPRGPFRAAVFDFDGTLSLIREGWASIMAQMGTERDGTNERFRHFEAGVLRLSGKPAINQMRWLANDLASRDRAAPAPEAMLDDFLHRLDAMCEGRRERLRNGDDPPESWAVPGTHAILRWFRDRGVRLVMASGTDRPSVVAESELLKIADFFDGGIFAPESNSAPFQKRDVFEMLLKQGVKPHEIVSFGDGYSETVEAKKIGAATIGLATVAVGDVGVNELKRAMLRELGADAILPDYREATSLLDLRGPASTSEVV